MLALSKIVLESFHDFWTACKNPLYTFFICKGGRNSAKSTTIAQKLIMETIENPFTTVVYRKVANTLSTTVYEQLKKAIIQLEVEGMFTLKKSPLEITYKERGNSIIFRGADDSEKSKGLTMSKFPIANIWFEEITEFKTEEEWDVIVDSILREELKGARYKIFVSYNPPKRKQHWVNKKWGTHTISSDTYIHHSDYRANHYLSSQAIQKIDWTKENNPKKYDWMYLGEAIGGGIVPFSNLDFRTITNEEIKSFDNIRQGIDWGYAVDPFIFGRWHYDKTRRIIYAIDEIYGVQLSNKKASNKIIERKYTDTMITADSAEPKSIAEVREYGIRIRPARKGQGSVEYGEKWLGDLQSIVIDPKRTPNTAREFENIDYEVDRDGNLKAKLEDKDNHSIDEARYAFENDMKKASVSFLT